MQTCAQLGSLKCILVFFSAKAEQFMSVLLKGLSISRMMRFQVLAICTTRFPLQDAQMLIKFLADWETAAPTTAVHKNYHLGIAISE